MELIYKTNNGRLIHGDNIEVMKKIKENSIDSCISDFPYAIEFMNKNWDSAKCWNKGEGKHGTFEGTGYTGKKRPAFYLNSNEDKLQFYDWCYERAVELHRIMKSGGYVCIFGHPKTNHRMKSAFEDAGFNIVEEIDWVYLTGMPKNQDIGKLFDKKAGVKREIIGYSEINDRKFPSGEGGTHGTLHGEYNQNGRESVNLAITTPATEQAKVWNGWKTAGLKPAHEPITIFQKPLDGTYIQNIEKYGCGGMNIDAVRVPINPEVDDSRLGGKGTWSTKKAAENIYEGGYAGERVSSSELGRFPPNMIMDEYIAEEFDKQTGEKTSKRSMRGIGLSDSLVYGKGDKNFDTERGYNDTGGGSRMFPIIKYCTKVSSKERLLPDGERNPHVTLKPVELIKWLIKLVTPKGGKTIDITAGSCTHAVATEELNRDEEYGLKWIDIELLNTDDDPYCNVGMERIKAVNS